MKKSLKDINDQTVRESYSNREKGCVFCEIKEEYIVDQEELVYVIRDIYPVTSFHTLIISFRHTKSYFEFYQPEYNEINKLIKKQKEWIQKKDKSVTGFNIVINDGESAGQTVNHGHIHLIPRRKNDGLRLNTP